MINCLKTHKYCSRCDTTLLVSSFGVNAAQPDGLQNHCLVCQRAYYRIWHQRKYARNAEFREASKQRAKERALQRSLNRYGLTLADYERLAARGCACCGGSSNGRGRLHFDHDHETGAFRGLLCSHCNTGIGKLGDSADGVARAVAYLDRSIAAEEHW